VNAYNSYNALVNWFTTFWVHEREAYIKHPYHFATTDHNLNLVQKIKFIIKQPVIDLDTLASFAIFHSMCNRSMFMHAHIADTFSSRSKDRHYLVHLFTEACSFAYINLQHNCKDPVRIHVNKLIMYYLWTKVNEQKKPGIHDPIWEYIMYWSHGILPFQSCTRIRSHVGDGGASSIYIQLTSCI
jgi:hypothetical protein